MIKTNDAFFAGVKWETLSENMRLIERLVREASAYGLLESKENIKRWKELEKEKEKLWEEYAE